MKARWQLWSCLIIAGCFLTPLWAQYVHTAEPPLFLGPGINHSSVRPTAGANQRHSYTSLFDGPTVPRIRWIVAGGMSAEVTHFAPPLIDPAGMLIVPQAPGSGTQRYSRYSYITPTAGRVMGFVLFGPSWNRFTRAPFWGQLTAATVFNTAVYLFGQNDIFLGSADNWPVFVFAGGQYDCMVYSPSPFLGVPDLEVNIGDLRSHGLPIRRVAAQKTHIGTYTDGLLSYALISDMVLLDDQGGALPNPVAVGVFWVASQRGTGAVLVIDYTSFAGASSAALGAGVFNEHNDSGFLGFHDGSVLVYDLTTIPTPSLTNAFTVMSLSLADLLDPNDWSSGIDPIQSDSVDRPIIVNRDNTNAFICATNNGRVYAVDALTGDRLWGTRLRPGLTTPITGGPALGTDEFGFETLYVVGRTASNRCTLFALDADTGNIKWQFPLQNISRCNPTVDRNGRVYVGDDRGILYSINYDGTLLWRLNLGASITVAPSIVLDANGTPIMLVAASNRTLFAIEERTIIDIPGGIGGVGIGGGP